MFEHPFDALSLEQLRRRESAKWRVYPADVLPAWLAETDFPLAEPIQRALQAAISRHDTGYATRGDLGRAFADWSGAHWGWAPDPDETHLVVDVVTALAELLRICSAPGDRVVIDPPVYPPFASVIEQHGRVVAPVPLARSEGGFAIDLTGVERAYRAGARVHILCSPHNPTGLVHSRDTLSTLAELAQRHGVWVISDEVHAPMTLPGAEHVPFPSVSPAAAARGILLASASKTWNLAGLKAALVIASGDASRALVGQLPLDLPYHAGLFGVIAGAAAFREGEAYRAELLRVLDRNRRELAELLREHLPGVAHVPPQAGYLAWLDFNALGWQEEPARRLLERGKVALSPGLTFGAQGKGWARLNIGTTAGLLRQAVERMQKALS
jgi:cystathionine beta-lyase